MRAARPVLAAVLLAAVAGCAPSAVPPVPQRQVAPPATPAAHAPEPRRSPSPSPVPVPVPVPVVQRGSGELVVVPGTSAPSGGGTRTTYVVEVESGLGVDARAFASAVEATLADPRSWGAGGRRAMQRLDRRDADLRITLASPVTVRRLCAPLDTGGYFSCANGDRAVVNVARWLLGAPSYAGHLEEYRAYVVNHEVGHALGLAHARCPGAGRTAPVMLQQTKGLDGCTRGPWPYP